MHSAPLRRGGAAGELDRARGARAAPRARGRRHLQRLRRQGSDASRAVAAAAAAVHRQRGRMGRHRARRAAARAPAQCHAGRRLRPADAAARGRAAAVAGVRASAVPAAGARRGAAAAACTCTSPPSTSRAAPTAAGGCCRSALQAPSGLGYLLENRLLVAQEFPEAFRRAARAAGGRRLRRRCSNALRALSPAGERSRIVLLTPGPLHETYFEQVFLARYLGITLVEGSDLTVRDRQLFLKTLQGLERVHVVLRRVDDEWLDPLELRADSALGVPGLLQALRAGEVVVANAPGAGVLESPGLAAFWPGVAKRLLGEELLLPASTHWWCGEDAVWQAQRARLPEFVVAATFPASATTQGFEPVVAADLDADAARGAERPHRRRPGGLHAAGPRAAVAHADVGRRRSRSARRRVARLRAGRRPRRLARAAWRHGTRGGHIDSRTQPRSVVVDAARQRQRRPVGDHRGRGRSHLAAAHRRCRQPTCRISSAP